MNQASKNPNYESLKLLAKCMRSTKNETDEDVLTRRREIEDRLLGERLLHVSDEEWRGLCLLVKALEESPRCRVTKRGTIIANFDDEVEVGLDVRKTIARKEAFSRLLDRAPTDSDHLAVYARSLDSGISKRVCIASSETYPEGTPATDKCVAFVLWANAGFREPPHTLVDAVEFCKDPEGFRELEESYEHRKQQARLRRQEEDDAIRRERRLRLARELQEARLGQLGWREIMQEHDSDIGEDTLDSVFARAIRKTILGGGAIGLAESESWLVARQDRFGPSNTFRVTKQDKEEKEWKR